VYVWWWKGIDELYYYDVITGQCKSVSTNFTETDSNEKDYIPATLDIIIIQVYKIRFEWIFL